MLNYKMQLVNWRIFIS